MLKMKRLCAALVAGAALLVSSPAQAQECGTRLVSTLLAGQHMVAGEVTVYNDSAFIYVIYTLASPWLMSEAHVAIASSLPGLPQTKSGNPIPGRFPYSASFDPETNMHAFVIPLSSFQGGQTIVLAAHAAVHAPRAQGGSQTAWADGADFPGANWATYINYQVQSCGGGGPE